MSLSLLTSPLKPLNDSSRFSSPFVLLQWFSSSVSPSGCLQSDCTLVDVLDNYSMNHLNHVWTMVKWLQRLLEFRNWILWHSIGSLWAIQSRILGRIPVRSSRSDYWNFQGFAFKRNSWNFTIFPRCTLVAVTTTFLPNEKNHVCNLRETNLSVPNGNPQSWLVARIERTVKTRSILLLSHQRGI